MIQKVNSKVIRQMHFVYMGKFLFHLSVSIQKTREKIWITFGDTTVSGMGQPVLHGFRGLRGFTGRGRGWPSILTGNPISLHVSDCNVLRRCCIFLNVSLKQLLFKNLLQATFGIQGKDTYVCTYINNRAPGALFENIRYWVTGGTYSTVAQTLYT